MELFDKDFPGHYLRLIKRVRTSVIALIPPTQGIHATLSTVGISRVVIGGRDIPQVVPIRRGPESVALSSPINATGLFELDAQPEMLVPFEGIGVDSTWEFRLPKPANLFDFGTIADVLITIEYTALDSPTYREQVIKALDRTFSADRPFSFRQHFADQWWDLHNPDQAPPPPMEVSFDISKDDFPANISNLTIMNVLLYFASKDRKPIKEEVNATLLFEPYDDTKSYGGAATSIEGVISGRRGNAASWSGLVGKTPIGKWKLVMPNNAAMRKRFQSDEFEDILLVITYVGGTPSWSM
jgi:hypothetical protein